jgi:hypothetical protein
VVTFFWANGARMSHFTPETDGAGYVLPPGIASLKDHQADFTVITGLKNGGSMKGSGDSHEKGRVCFATGVPSPSGRAAGGPSIEQYLGKKLGSATRIPAVSISPTVGQGGESAYSAWAGPSQSVPPIVKPTVLFATLFTNGIDPSLGAAQLEAIRKRRKSALDFVKRDLTRVNARLGSSDKLRLDAHLDAVREVERRLLADETAQKATGGVCGSPTPPPVDAKSDPWQWTYQGAPLSRYNLLEDLMVLAFQCDVTRFAAMKLNIEIDKWIHKSFPGETRGHHDISHDTSAAAKEIHTAYTNYQVGFIGQLMAKLKAAPLEGDKSLLHNSLIYASSEISDGSAHNYTNMPVILAGHGGGKVKTGRHLNLLPFLTPGKWAGVKDDVWTDLGALFLAMAQIAGADAKSWGEVTKPLDLGA